MNPHLSKRASCSLQVQPPTEGSERRREDEYRGGGGEVGEGGGGGERMSIDPRKSPKPTTGSLRPPPPTQQGGSNSSDFYINKCLYSLQRMLAVISPTFDLKSGEPDLKRCQRWKSKTSQVYRPPWVALRYAAAQRGARQPRTAHQQQQHPPHGNFDGRESEKRLSSWF